MTPSKPPALVALEHIAEPGVNWLETRFAGNIALPDAGSYPVYVIAMGNPALHACVVGYFGDVHGLERFARSCKRGAQPDTGRRARGCSSGAEMVAR